ncbi:MAG: hypothetical protein JSV80_07255, partial [Acidobacteriota bacterium]
RAMWLREHHEIDDDPLAAAPRGSLQAFRVRITANGRLSVHVQTQGVRLWPERGEQGVPPLDYTRAYELLRVGHQGGAQPADVDRLMRGVLDGAIQVPAGRAREGLLVFPEPPVESRAMQLELPFVQVGAETHRLRVPFAKLYLGTDDR